MFLRRIHEGMARLDEVNPGWADQVDLARLYLADPARCVVGQVYGGYEYGLAMLDVPWNSADIYGFTTPAFKDMDTLTREWTKAIHAIRKA